jgi:serine/threonine protein kinase
MQGICPETIINNKFILRKVLGNGKFGQVFQAVDLTTGDYVAVKREPKNTPYSSIKHEVKILSYLFQHKFKKIPFIYWYGNCDDFTYFVMSYYDCSLSHFLGSDSVCISNAFGQCIQLLESIHTLFVLHRDIKPENFMVKNGEIVFIDFGLATFYIDENGEHIPNQSQDSIIGTPKYVSYYNHCGNTLSRRDDLISLGYMFLGFYDCKMPWEQCSDTERIRKKSWNILQNSLENYKNLYHYMNYCYHLDFYEKPNYDILWGCCGGDLCSGSG